MDIKDLTQNFQNYTVKELNIIAQAVKDEKERRDKEELKKCIQVASDALYKLDASLGKRVTVNIEDYNGEWVTGELDLAELSEVLGEYLP